MITTAEFKIRFPEFVGEEDARVQLFIDDAVLILNETYWDTKYDLGLSYQTAHCLALANKTSAAGGGNAGNAGPVTSRAVDGASVAYGGVLAAKDQGEAYYMQTVYGQRYLTLIKSLGIVAAVV